MTINRLMFDLQTQIVNNKNNKTKNHNNDDDDNSSGKTGSMDKIEQFICELFALNDGTTRERILSRLKHIQERLDH